MHQKHHISANPRQFNINMHILQIGAIFSSLTQWEKKCSAHLSLYNVIPVTCTEFSSSLDSYQKMHFAATKPVLKWNSEVFICTSWMEAL